MESNEILYQKAAGDPEALGELYDRLAKRLYQFVRFRVGSVQEAEDIVSLVFERLVVASSSTVVIEKIEGWIFTVARRLVIDHWRSRRQDVSVDDVDVVDLTESIEELLTNQSDVARAMRQLTEEERSLLVLHVVDGFSLAELAQELGITTIAARKRFSRIKSKCQQSYANS